MEKQYNKIYAVSDVHGFYSELIAALAGAGYDERRDDELLVFCGDMFDRGTENLRVFNFFRNRRDCVLIRGNHDERMAELLTSRHLSHSDIHNGTDETIREFFGMDCIKGDGSFEIPEDCDFAGKYRELYAKMVDYYEFGDYIFTHGWLPVKYEGYIPYLDPDWRHADGPAWKNARWLEWQQLYTVKRRIAVPGKTVVCGHRSASLAATVDPDRFSDDYSIYRGDGVIAIDACTAASGRVNVLVIDCGS